MGAANVRSMAESAVHTNEYHLPLQPLVKLIRQIRMAKGTLPDVRVTVDESAFPASVAITRIIPRIERKGSKGRKWTGERTKLGNGRVKHQMKAMTKEVVTVTLWQRHSETERNDLVTFLI